MVAWRCCWREDLLGNWSLRHCQIHQHPALWSPHCRLPWPPPVLVHRYLHSDQHLDFPGRLSRRYQWPILHLYLIKSYPPAYQFGSHRGHLPSRRGLVHRMVLDAIPGKCGDFPDQNPQFQCVDLHGVALGLLFWMFTSNAESALGDGSLWSFHILRLYMPLVPGLCFLLHAGKHLDCYMKRSSTELCQETAGRSLESLDSLFERPLYSIHKVAYPTEEAVLGNVDGTGKTDLEASYVEETQQKSFA
jgi:hypothetical protein